MEQNNLNPQGSTTETREPLPQFGAQPQAVVGEEREPLPTYGFAAPAPEFAQPTSMQASNAKIEECVNSAFGKSLASAIMSWFPVCSIIAIILGSIGLKNVKKADELAAYYGISAGGKRIAAKILGMIGLISGIVMTVLWSLYFLLIIAMIAALGV